MRARLGGLLLFLLGIASSFVAHATGDHVLDTSKENMERIAQSLGVKCTHCHTQKTADGKIDHEAPSVLKETAIHMKVHFVDSLRTGAGKPLDCQTCHQGHATFLPRSLEGAKPSELSKHMARRDIFKRMKAIEKALGVTCDFCHVRNKEGRLTPDQPTEHKVMAKFMMENYAGSLQKLDGSLADCATCHQGEAEFLPRSN